MHGFFELRRRESFADLVDREVAFVVKLDEEGDELGRVAVAFAQAGVYKGKGEEVR